MAENDDPYRDVKEDAERLTKARLQKSPDAENNDLTIEPIVQAVTPNDAEAKKANTGGVSVKGSPDGYSGPVSDGFTDGAAEEQVADTTASNAKANKSSK